VVNKLLRELLNRIEDQIACRSNGLFGFELDPALSEIVSRADDGTFAIHALGERDSIVWEKWEYSGPVVSPGKWNRTMALLREHLKTLEAPTHKTPIAYTPSNFEQQLIDMITEVGKRLTTNQVLAELNKRHGPTSEGTTKSALATLTRAGILNNRSDLKPKGYGLPGWD